MIDTKELRECIAVFGSQAINEDDLNELLDRLEEVEKERDALRAEVESWKGLAQQFGKEADALRAKIAEMEKQKPVGTLHDDGYFVWSTSRPYESNFAGWKMKLYGLPGVKGE